MIKLAIITTHPIQYYAPVFRLLHERHQIDIKVFYSWGEAALNNYDPGFGKTITWDIPLLEGYPYEWVRNIAPAPGSHHFKGIVNPDLVNRINIYKPEAILVIGWAYHSHLKVIRYFKNKIPVLFRGDSTLIDEKGGLKSMARSLFLKWVYNPIDYAFYNGVNNKAYFKKYGLTESQLIFAPHAIDNERFGLDRTDEALLLKQSLGLAETDMLVLFAGKLEDKKDPGLLLDAFIALNNPKTHLLLVGNGTLGSQLKLKAKPYPNIHFIDFQNQSYMPVIYQACDLFCLPSKGPAETWGLAINEAMACAKPILVSDKVGAAANLVKPGVNGAIFKAGSLTDMMNNLTQLIKGGKNQLIKMGGHSKELIKDWNFEAQAKAIEAAITNNIFTKK